VILTVVADEVAVEPDGAPPSLGWSARVYHLKVLAFAEECVAHARHTAPRVF
jgi:hypothetical protein